MQVDKQAVAPEGFSLDARWSAVMDEALRRPPIPANAPGHAAALAFLTSNDEADAHRAHMLQLLAGWGAAVELDRSDQILASTYALQVKWERHTEFCAIVVISRAGHSQRDLGAWPPFPAQWRKDCPGQLIGALKIALEPKGSPAFIPGFIDETGAMNRVLSEVNAGAATVEASLRPAGDGYVHFFVRAEEPEPSRLGRLVQRLIEVETYRTLALYAWPDVQEIGPRLNEIDNGLVSLTEALGTVQQGGEQQLLDRLTELARDLEHITARTHFRLNASIAYHDLVQRRLEDLREVRVEGSQRLSSLVNRRLSPAARTYAAILRRQGEMSERISRTSDLLRSRIDVELARQNQDLLASMDRRAHQQYRLQQTVEGLSVVAISYYAIGIVSYLLTALSGLVHGLEVKLWTGIAAPVVLLAVYLAMRRLRSRFHDE